jgi:hypothetical protein
LIIANGSRDAIGSWSILQGRQRFFSGKDEWEGIRSGGVQTWHRFGSRVLGLCVRQGLLPVKDVRGGLHSGDVVYRHGTGLGPGYLVHAFGRACSR